MRASHIAGIVCSLNVDCDRTRCENARQDAGGFIDDKGHVSGVSGMLLRSFNIPDNFNTQLEARANAQGVSKHTLVREYIELAPDKQHLSNNVWYDLDHWEMRGFYLTPEQDLKLREMAANNRITKVAVFHAILAKYLANKV